MCNEGNNMRGKSGRPRKEEQGDSRAKIIHATIRLVNKLDPASITIRKVCEKASVSIGTFYHYFRNKNELMMYFIREIYYFKGTLSTPEDDITGRICELYDYYLDIVVNLGWEFMRQFYHSSNMDVESYKNNKGENVFDTDHPTYIKCSEIEMLRAYDMGLLMEDVNIRDACLDIATIVVGCITRWCMVSNDVDLKEMAHRIIRNYMLNIIKNEN